MCSSTMMGVPLTISETRPLDERGFDAFCAQAGQAAGLANAANATLVAMVVRCLAERWWEVQQTQSPEHWCRVLLGVSRATAQKLVRVAREIVDYPTVSVAFCEGRMSLDQVEVIVTTAHPMYDSALADAGRWPIDRMRRIIANHPHAKPEPAPESAPLPPNDGEDPEPAPAPAPPLDLWRGGWGDDGRHRGSWDVGPELGATYERALAAARDELFKARTGTDPEGQDRTGEASSVTTVDAVSRMLHAALDGLDPAIARGARPSERTQVVIHVPADRPDAARLHLGPLLPASVRRHLTCDADLRAVLTVRGVPVETWRRQRVVNRPLRLLIEHRDGGCVVPGCGRTRFLHVHHLVHWEDGGPTIPANLACLCPEHHRLVHAGQLHLLGDPTTPEGLTVLDRHRRPWPQPGPQPPTHLPAPAAPFPPTLWGGRLHLN